MSKKEWVLCAFGCELESIRAFQSRASAKKNLAAFCWQT